MTDAHERLAEKLAAVPGKPGVYLFRDTSGKILYVGKAKALRPRLRSYFRKSGGLDARKTAMMRAVSDFEFTVTGNELEAFVLEANLIKQFRPRYNVLLRDDKNYPYLRLTVHEEWPRLEVVRRVRRDGARYFGPYIPASAMWNILTVIRNDFRMPSCRYDLTKRMRPCIQHQIGRCDAPCAGLVDPGTYRAMVDEIRMILEGKNTQLIGKLENRMQSLSDEMRYEEAALVRDRIGAVGKIAETQKMVDPSLGDADVIGMHREGELLGIKMFFIRNGVMVGSREFLLKNAAGETDSLCLKEFMEQFYGRDIMLPDQVLCPVVPEDADLLGAWLSERHGKKVVISSPRRGIRKKLVAMANENAEIVLGTLGRDEGQEILQEVGLKLGFDHPPKSIGAFDISNFGGKEAVGAYVLWEDGSFRKERYRHIRMSDVPGPDDYGMMREMIRRTVESIGEELPDLLIIDGGREHLKAAIGVLHNQQFPRERIVSIAKEPDRVFLPDRAAPIPLDDGRPASLLLRRIRDEAHRFGLRYHRALRSRKAFETPLDAVYGIGRKRRFALLERFGTIEAIKQAGVDEIAQVNGFTRKLAQDVLAALGAKKTEGRT